MCSGDGAREDAGEQDVVAREDEECAVYGHAKGAEAEAEQAVDDEDADEDEN